MEDIVTLGLLGLYAAMLVLDMVAPARQLTSVRLWRLKGIVFFVTSIGLFTAAPFLWTEWLSQYRLIDASGLGIVPGAIVGVLTMQLVNYWWHRSMHNSNFLWRWFHQMHHSAERVDAFGAFVFHPFDAIGFAFTGSFALTVIVGLRPEAALAANAFGTFLAFFNHSNIRTPQWLGYIIQRPENHALHHERGVHGYNYGDIAFWDMVFGTFRNPKEFPREAGFYDGASSRIGEMLIGRDVSVPVKEMAPRDSTPRDSSQGMAEAA